MTMAGQSILGRFYISRTAERRTVVSDLPNEILPFSKHRLTEASSSELQQMRG
jgi:hypothetical protein